MKRMFLCFVLFHKLIHFTTSQKHLLFFPLSFFQNISVDFNSSKFQFWNVSAKICTFVIVNKLVRVTRIQYNFTWTLFVCYWYYSNPPLMWPPLLQTKSGHIRGVAGGDKNWLTKTKCILTNNFILIMKLR